MAGRNKGEEIDVSILINIKEGYEKDNRKIGKELNKHLGFSSPQSALDMMNQWIKDGRMGKASIERFISAFGVDPRK